MLRELILGDIAASSFPSDSQYQSRLHQESRVEATGMKLQRIWLGPSRKFAAYQVASYHSYWMNLTS
jgi:hypothetical protein